MPTAVCKWETRVLDAVLSGRWPEACEQELRCHTVECAVCSDLVLVAVALAQARGPACAEVRLPSAGLVWWKAQVRARREAAEQAAQPIVIAERVASAFGILALLGVVIWQWSRVSEWFRWLGDLFHGDASRFGDLHTFGPGVGLWSGDFNLTWVLGGCLLLASFVLYLVFVEE